MPEISDNVFFLMRAEKIQIALKRAIIGPPAKRHITTAKHRLNGVSLAGR